MARSMKCEAERIRSRKEESNTCGSCGVEISDAEIICNVCKPTITGEKARAAYAGNA